jgi:hypothetical protein
MEPWASGMALGMLLGAVLFVLIIGVGIAVLALMIICWTLYGVACFTLVRLPIAIFENCPWFGLREEWAEYLRQHPESRKRLTFARK